jgi:hypothetical protein
MRPCISSLGCRNADLHLLLRMQEVIVLSMGGMGYSLICLKSSDPTHRIYNISN